MVEKSRRTACGSVPTGPNELVCIDLGCLGARELCKICRRVGAARYRMPVTGARPMSGIHHVTAISGRADRNLDFYARVLGLRLVKKTVNFDDPGTYHLYYGDEQGQPGTILTFFPWAHAAPGHLGVGETQETAFRIPAAALG